MNQTRQGKKCRPVFTRFELIYIYQALIGNPWKVGDPEFRIGVKRRIRKLIQRWL